MKEFSEIRSNKYQNKLIISNFLNGFIFWYAVEKLFMSSIGISVGQVGLVTSFLFLSIFIFDIPSGILADRWSRKGTAVIGAVFSALASLVLGLSAGIGVFIAGYILHGIFVSALSGTYSAMMYDSIIDCSASLKKKIFTIMQGRLQFAYLGGVTLGNITGSVLARDYSLNTLFFISIIPALLNVALLLGLEEEGKHSLGKRDKGIRKTLNLPQKSRYWLAVFLTFAILTQFRNDYFQLFTVEIGVSDAFDVGMIWTVLIVLVAMGSLYAHRLSAYFKEIVVLIPILFIISIIGGWLGLLILGIAGALLGAISVLLSERLNSTFPSSRRSILLSTISSIKSIVAIGSTIVIGLAGESLGLANTAAGVGALSLICLALVLSLSKRSFN